MSAEQEARDLLEACGVEDAQSFTAGDVVALANYISEHNMLKVQALTRDAIHERDVEAERQRSNRWQKLAGAYDDIRYALRNAPDTPEGHAEFYQKAAELIFGEQS